MLRGLWKLTWLETKIFLREPLGVIGTVGFPILLFVILRRIGRGAPRATLPPLLAGDLPIMAAVMVAVSAVVSLVAIIAIYREGGILKRLRATPLQPVTILLAHVIVKLGFTALSLAVLMLAGARSFGPAGSAHVVSFAAALLFTTLCLLSIGFIIASVVPTARFAQPLATLIVYTMLGFSGLFVAIDRLPPGHAGDRPRAADVACRVVVAWDLEGRGMARTRLDVAALTVLFVVATLHLLARLSLGVIRGAFQDSANATEVLRSQVSGLRQSPARPPRLERAPGHDPLDQVVRPAPGPRRSPEVSRSRHRNRPCTPQGSTRTRCADGSTRISTKLWKNGASLESNSADSHSAVNGHPPRSRVHHQAGRFHQGVDASIFFATSACPG